MNIKLVEGVPSSKHPLYITWVNMKLRCYNKNNNRYKNYGGRGIKVCNRWLNSFSDFVYDLGTKPSNHSIDRINNDGDYEPNNIRWATAKEQCVSRRTALGLDNGRCKLSRDKVEKIRILFKTGNYSHLDLSLLFSLSSSYICNLVNNKRRIILDN